MQNVSGNYLRAQLAQDKYYQIRVLIDGAGTIPESRIFSLSTNVEAFPGARVGVAAAGEISLTILNPSGTIPTMARIRPQIRACGTAPKSSSATVAGERMTITGATVSGERMTISADVTVEDENMIFPVDGEEFLRSEWIQQGIYYIDTRELTANDDGLDVLTLHGFDAMLKTERDYTSNIAVGDDYDVNYVRAIAADIGVPVDKRTWEIMGQGYLLPSAISYSEREILGYIAAGYGGSFVITDTGELLLVSIATIPAETNLLIDSIGDVITIGGDSLLV